jgi:hypothetical protein
MSDRITPFTTAEELLSFVVGAWPGDRAEYHRGYLMVDADLEFSTLGEPELARVIKLRALARDLSDRGLVHLVQEREDDFVYRYLAVRSRRPRGSRLSATPEIEFA